MDPSKVSESISDKQVISRVLQGETKAYEIIVRRYNAYLYKIGRSYGYRHEDVEDLMQETYVNAFINLASFENRSSFLTWISRIMLNNCYHKKEKFSFQKELAAQNTIEEKSIPMFNGRQTDTHKTVLNDELKAVLEEAVLHIPEPYRIVFTLRELNGMSVKETSSALQLSEANVKVRLNRAKGLLRTEIRKNYSPEEIFEFNLIYCDKMVERVMKAIEKEQIRQSPY